MVKGSQPFFMQPSAALHASASELFTLHLSLNQFSNRLYCAIDAELGC